MKKVLRKMAICSSNMVYSFIRNHRGLAMVEFALILPVMVLLTAGSFEVARYALITQKLDRIVATMSDLIARADETMSAAEVANLLLSAEHLAKPFDFNSDGMVILTSVVGRAGQAPLIISQRTQGSVSGATSSIGADGGDATLPPSFVDVGSGETLADGESVIVAEIIYEYSPYLLDSLGFFNDQIFYRDAYFRPRFSATITF